MMDKQELIYKPYEEGQEKDISDMIWDVFSEFEAPEYSKEGINIFKDFINPQRLADDIRYNGFKIYCCFEGDILAGVLALRNQKHISLLFVRKSHHKKGIARELVRMIIEYIQKANPYVHELTVNSSPYAVEIYKKLGFTATDTMQEKDGIIYMPMIKFI
jgi:GNAT superfamily N-acetyltransferase